MKLLSAVHWSILLLLSIARMTEAAGREAVVARLQVVSSARNLSEFNRGISNLLQYAASNKAEIRSALVRYEAFYKTNMTQRSVDLRRKATEARALMYAAGACRFHDLIKPYVTTTNRESFVIFAYAESRGFKLYYSVTEDAWLDCIVTPLQAMEIVRVNKLL